LSSFGPNDWGRTVRADKSSLVALRLFMGRQAGREEMCVCVNDAVRA
jgi:hypothetical protein